MVLVERWGTSISLPGGTYRAFPAPEQLAPVETGDLATLLGNKRKAEYLRAVIEFFNEVDEQFLRTGDYDQVVASLHGIRGIGEWSSHFILVRGLGRMERVSAIDKELSTAAAKIYNGGHSLATAEMQRLLDQYGTAQGYWAFYARIATLDRQEIMGMQ
ncbi:MAG: DNA-3-methyladenine glycosylase family protein, partial [Ktedonobacteraceae bacterium]